jgi:glucokinase
LTPQQGPILACDLGGTRMKLGLVRGGRVLAQSVIPAHSDRGLGPRLPALTSALRELLALQKLESAQCRGIGISFPSLIDYASGRIIAEYGKYRDAMSIDLRAWAKAEFNLPLAIENDARMALIGEWRSGAGRGSDNLAMMTLGTGLGTAVVIEGRVLRGVHGQAACLGGHTTVRYGGRPCNCHNVGCAEAEASTAFLAEIAHARPDFATSALAHEPLLDFSAVFRHAANGDACAISIRDHSLEVWSALAVNLVHFFDPEKIIVGGGIMVSADVILNYMRQYVHRHAHTPWGKVEVVASELGDQAALVACQWLVEEYLKTL